MARSVYIAGLGPSGGKSTIALGLAELLSRQVARLGVFRPLVPAGAPDPILRLLTSRYPVSAPYADSYGVTAAEAAAMVADGRREELISRIVERYREVERRCAAVVVVGSDFADGGDAGPGGLPRELAFNARLATEFSSVVVAVVDGRHNAVATAARTAYHSLAELGATVLAVIANRVPPGTPAPELDAAVPVYVIPELPVVAAPTVAEVATALDATVLTGEASALDRDVLHFVVGAAHVPVLLDHLTDGSLMITPGDRADLLVAACAAHTAGNVSLAGVVLTLGEHPDPRAMRVVERLNTGLAVLVAETDSYDTIAAASRITGRLSMSSPRKVQAALGAFESGVDTEELSRRLDVTRSARVTPLMFENALIDRARANRRHLVLPEGTDERILRAAEILIRRGVADLTLLGNPEEINRRVRELGLDVS
ncbi:MAG TPA: phosphate acyltransferase, partial [Catenuloplanes sp.]